MKTQKQIRKEARIVVAFISLGIACLLWAVHANAVIGDAYAATVLAVVLVTLGALGSFIVTTELRDNMSRNSRAIILALHAQQVNALQNENDELRAHNENTENARQVWHDEYKTKAHELTNLANRYSEARARVAQLEHMNDANFMQIQKLNAEVSRLQNGVMGIREELDYGSEYTYSASTALLLGTLDQAEIVRGETRYPLRNK